MSTGCFKCDKAQWDADGCTCKITGLLVGNAARGCKYCKGTELNPKKAPAADVQPVKHGRWEETHISLCKWIPEDEKEEGHSFYMAEMKCSCCERYNTQTFSLTLNKPDYCQHCGAKMNKE